MSRSIGYQCLTSDQTNRNMKSMCIAVLAVVALAAAAPAAPAGPTSEVPQVIEQNLDQNPDGSYKSSFKTSNGIEQNEEAEVKEVPNEKGELVPALVVRGSYSYEGPDGPVVVNYVADENGFQATGDHIPKPAGAERR